MGLRSLLGLERPEYWLQRADSIYFRYVDYLVRVVGRDAKSILDVGSNNCRYLEWFTWIPRKVSIDRRSPYRSLRVRGKKVDFLKYNPDQEFDLCLCLQVLEHIRDAQTFARKLLAVSHHVIISVPYRWPEGTNRGHVHDPVDEDKVRAWFGRAPNYEIIVAEPITEKKRLICYFDRDHPERKLGLEEFTARRMPAKAA